MYNAEVKSKYLETKRETTGRQYKSLFDKLEPYEKALNKEIIEFTLDEILDTLVEIKTKNESQEKVYKAIISGYINWSIEQGFRFNPINPLLSHTDLE